MIPESPFFLAHFLCFFEICLPTKARQSSAPPETSQLVGSSSSLLWLSDDLDSFTLLLFTFGSHPLTVHSLVWLTSETLLRAVSLTLLIGLQHAKNFLSSGENRGEVAAGQRLATPSGLKRTPVSSRYATIIRKILHSVTSKGGKVSYFLQLFFSLLILRQLQ